MAGFGLSVRASSHASLDLPLFQQAVLRAKRDYDSLGFDPFGFGIGMQPARAGQRLNAGEIDVLAAFPAQASFQQFVPPFLWRRVGARARR